MFKTYYQLAKPGIIYGNLLTAIGGFLFAADGRIDILLLLALGFGMSLLIGSGCVFNNYLDRDIDAKMRRTQKRALVREAIDTRSALLYGAVLGIVGIALLALFTNRTTVLLGIVGFVSYVFVYTFLKRKTVHGTLIGTVPGATPLVAGYTAVTGRLDLDALLLFLIMVAWQMPHFFAIAIFRRDDYAAAGIPVLSVVRGIRATKIQMVAYMVLFIISIVLLYAFGSAGLTYLIVMGLLASRWLAMGLSGFRADTDNIAWSRQVFKFSLFIILGLSITLALDAWLP